MLPFNFRSFLRGCLMGTSILLVLWVLWPCGCCGASCSHPGSDGCLRVPSTARGQKVVYTLQLLGFHLEEGELDRLDVGPRIEW